MSSRYSLGNFGSPLPLEKDIGLPTQIAYYSYFPDPVDYGYQSRDALRRFQPHKAPFLLTTAIKKPAFDKICTHLDSLPQQGLEPVITSCKQADYADLSKADIITRRGVMTDLSLGIKGVYDISFVGGQLHILRGTFNLRAKSPNNGPYYGHCFEKLCTRSTADKPHGEFFSVVQRQIGDLNIIMAGEVDCSKSGGPHLNDYIELKTVRKLKRRHRAKLFANWYLQSYLLGVPTLAIGYRKSAYKVSRIDVKSIEEVCQDAQKYSPTFTPAQALGRAHAILSSLLEYLRPRGETVSAKLRVNAKGGVWLSFDHATIRHRIL